MKQIAFLFASLLSLCLLGWSCDAPTSANKEQLPYLGFHEVDETTGDTTYHQIRDFAFVDQDSQIITNEYFAGKAYVADFFFTSCPTICPKVKQQMLRVYHKYENDDRLALLSHSIDVKRDTVAKLKRYAQGLGADSPKWRFVTGDKKEIFAITYDYISTALDAPEVPGGFDHSGYLLLVDENRHLRAFANGTNAEEVTKFLDEIDLLLAEMDN